MALNNFSGTWIVDRTHSDDISEFLRILGVNRLAASISSSLDVQQIIHHTPFSLTWSDESALGSLETSVLLSDRLHLAKQGNSMIPARARQDSTTGDITIELSFGESGVSSLDSRTRDQIIEQRSSASSPSSGSGSRSRLPAPERSSLLRTVDRRHLVSRTRFLQTLTLCSAENIGLSLFFSKGFRCSHHSL